MVGMKEDTDPREPWVLHTNNELWNTTPKTGDAPYGA